MYNVRVKKFLDTEQIQIYSKNMLSASDKVSVDLETGEFLKNGKRPKSDKGQLEYNPFTDKCEKMYKFTDPDRSLSVSFARTKTKVYDVARSNHWEWFLSLTFSPDNVCRQSYDDCAKKLSQWLNNARKVAPNMKYVVVPELHKDKVSWHFHGLFSNIDELGLEFNGHYYKGRKCYDVFKYKLGHVTAIRSDGSPKIVSYIMEYVTKDLCSLTKGRKRYWTSRNLDKPEIIDIQVDDLVDFRRSMVEQSGFVKTVNGEYLDVTYIEVEKGSSEAELFGEQSIRQISTCLF